MKYFRTLFLALMLLLGLIPMARATGPIAPLPLTNEFNGVFWDHSFDDSTNVIWSTAMASYISGMYPQYTNHIWNPSHAGNGLQGDYENDEARRLFPQFAAVDPTLTAWNIFMAGDDNGGYDSNGVVQWSTNIMAFPALVWNGTGSTNEGITTCPIIHLPIGGAPEDTSTGGGANQIARNNAATNLAGVNGLVLVDTWHDLWNNGWSTDQPGPRLLGFYSGNHLYRAGYLAMALYNLIALGAETNIGSCTIDFNAAITRNSSHMTISGLQLAGATLTFTNLCDRMPGAWVVGPGQTGCDDCFAAMPQLADKFQWQLEITNLPPNLNWKVEIDNVKVATFTSAQLAHWNMFSFTNGPLWDARKAVFNARLDQLGIDHTTLSPAHDAATHGVGGNLDRINYLSASTFYPATFRGSAYISSMSTYVAGLQALDVLIRTAAQQVPHFFRISPELPRYQGRR